MPWLERLHEAGFRIWPFESAALGVFFNVTLMFDIYTRLLTGPVKKANKDARRAYLKARREVDTLAAELPRAVLAEAEGSEDAFDALVCCVEMVRHRAEFAGLRRTDDPTLQLEGITWRPGV